MIKKDRLQSICSGFSSANNIMVVGDIGLDHYIYGSVDRISPEAPVPVLRVTKEENRLGMAANICHNLFSLGAKSSLVSVVGKDRKGEELLKMLELEGVVTKGLVRHEQVTTISKDRVLTTRQQICRVDYESEFPGYSDLVHESMSKAFEQELTSLDYIILEDYSKGVFTEKSMQNFIKRGTSAGKFVAIDPGRGKPASFFKGATLLKPNLSEAKELVHSLGYSAKSVHEMVEILTDKLDLSSIVITLGADGLALFDRNSSQGTTILPTLASEVFDVSGAGDTVISVIILALSCGADLFEACWLANIAAGVVVSKSGTATVNVKEIEEYYEYVKNKSL